MSPLDTAHTAQERDRVDDILNLINDVASGAAERGQLDEPCKAFVEYLKKGGPLPDATKAAKLLLELRNVRAIPNLVHVGEILVTLGCNEPEVRQHFAQGLIEAQQLVAGIAVATQIEADTRDRPDLNGIAHGLLGRAYKQVYTDHCTVRKDAAFARNLQKALDHYIMCHDKVGPELKSWPAINLIAIIERAKKDGVQLQGAPDSAPLARELIKTLDGDEAKRKDPWVAVSLGQAYLALGDVKSAAEWFGRYVRNQTVTAFALFGTIRQLEEVWGLKAGTEGAEPIVMALKTKLLQKDHGFIELSREEQKTIVNTAPTDYGPSAEAVLGVGPDEGFVEIEWLRKGIERARAVVRVCKGMQTMGTGFLVRGDDFDEALGDDLFVLTNAHVVCPPEMGESAVTAEQARIVLDRLDGDTKFYTCEIVWSSPIRDLDATLLRVKERVDDAAPLRLPPKDVELCAELAEPKGKPSRLYVLGHPMGRSLALSFADTKNTVLVDLGPREPGQPFVYMHYRTPTEPGSSGSPVFEHKGWDVVGLHRAGPDRRTGKLRRLKGLTAEYEANEGVYLPSIRRAIREARGQSRGTAAPSSAPAPATAPSPAAAPSGAAQSTERVNYETLTRLLHDPRTPERQLAPYFKEDMARSGPYAPQIVLDWSRLADGPEKQAAHLEIVGLGSFLARRRQMQFERRMHEQGGGGLRLVADGDSWLEYPIFVDDLTDHLSREFAISPVAADRDDPPGLGDIAAAANLEKIAAAIAATRAHGLVLSGGGSDLFGPALERFFKPFSPEREAKDYVLDTLSGTLRTVEAHYRTLFDYVLARYPNLKIFTHGYDLPSVRPGGRWLARPLEAKDISAPALQTRLVRLVLDRLNGVQAGLARSYDGRVVYVDCRGAVANDRQWLDELHPDDAGFARVAERFRAAIGKTFGR